MRPLSILSLFPLAHAITPARLPHQPLGNGTQRLTYNITTDAPGPLAASSRSFSWISSSSDGDYVFQNSTTGALTFENVATGASTPFISADKVPAGEVDFSISPDANYVLWATNYTKQYRYSYFSDYLIQDVRTGSTVSLDPSSVGDIQFASWNPASSSQIAFVKGNDLYLWTNGTISRVTSSGGPDFFNAVPDWVYEEEIFGDRSTMWWSPDGAKIAFLTFNETGVGTFRVPYYMDGNAVAPGYPRELELRYPKVGSKNPVVGMQLLDVASGAVSELPIDVFPDDDLVVGEVAWVTETHGKVLYRAYNRVQDLEKVVVVDVESGSSKIVRERDGTDGWLENLLQVSYIGALARSNATYSNSSTEYYLDISDQSGWAHIYLFPVEGGAPIALTSGDWEVLSILKIDNKRNLVYYTSTQHHSTESHIYSVSLLTGLTKPLVDDTIPAFWTASFSAGGSYYVLRYAGPDVPYQELYSLNSTTTPLRTIIDNAALYTRLQSYALPNITYLDLPHPSGYTLDAMLRLPPSFDPSKKYPLLLIPYGGPNAKEVTKQFSALNWKAYVASDPDLEYITLTVDNRGTGRKGRAFRSLVTSNLGMLESEDQIWAAKYLASTYGFVDTAHVGIWGWSYGGYLSAKVVERADPAISFAMITAPVSDWRFYDTLYTERYMKTPALNPGGYNVSRVASATGFKNIAGGVVIQHGTGDDNVHFQNAAALVDLLVGARVTPEKLDHSWFTDSDHSIVYNQASKFLYRQLSKKVYEEKNRVGDSKGSHQWSRRSVDMGVGRRWVA